MRQLEKVSCVQGMADAGPTESPHACCLLWIFSRESGSVSEGSDPIFTESTVRVKENLPGRVPWFQPTGSCPAVRGKAKPGNHSSSGCLVMENTPGEG